MWDLLDRRFCYQDGIRSVRYHLNRRGMTVFSWDEITYADYSLTPLTRATHGGVMALLYGVDLTPSA